MDFDLTWHPKKVCQNIIKILIFRVIFWIASWIVGILQSLQIKPIYLINHMMLYTKGIISTKIFTPYTRFDCRVYHKKKIWKIKPSGLSGTCTENAIEWQERFRNFTFGIALEIKKSWVLTDQSPIQAWPYWTIIFLNNDPKKITRIFSLVKILPWTWKESGYV
jgi:hypothetical protein